MNACNLFCLVLLMLLGISGCGTTRPVPSTAVQSASYYKPAADIGSVEAGSIVSVDIDGASNLVEGYLGAPYASASGKICRYFNPVSKGSATRTLCNLGNDEWFFQKSLSQRVSSVVGSDATGRELVGPEDHSSNAAVSILGTVNSQRSILPSQESSPVDLIAPDSRASEPVAVDVAAINTVVVETEPAKSVESETFVIRRGENLWKFSKRVTGAGKNWPIIALENGISQEDKIFAGALLSVPQALIPER